MLEGQIDFFTSDKGYGFIDCEELDDDVFFLVSEVLGDVDKLYNAERGRRPWCRFEHRENEGGLIADMVVIPRNSYIYEDEGGY